MSVKRYTHDRSSYRPSFMDEQSDGDYVLHSDYTALLARHNALVEAVENERRLETAQDDFDAPDDHFDAMTAARAEVDRLIANERAANCEGDG